MTATATCCWSGDLLLVQSERGEMLLIEARPEEHPVLGRFMALPGKAWGIPFAIAGDRLLVRNDAEAALGGFRSRRPRPPPPRSSSAS